MKHNGLLEMAVEMVKRLDNTIDKTNSEKNRNPISRIYDRFINLYVFFRCRGYDVAL